MQHYTEQNQETSLFGFGIDQSSRAHLAEAAKWAKFLAIVGFVMCGLIIVLSFFIGALFSTSMSKYGDSACIWQRLRYYYDYCLFKFWGIIFFPLLIPFQVCQ
jgi:hypothetical protein